MYRMIRSDVYYDKSGHLDVDYYNQRHGGISTQLGKNKKGDPYLATDEDFLRGHPVYSVYALKNDEHINIFRDIKKGNMNPDLYNEWVRTTAQYIWSNIVYDNKPDIIAVPQSSSTLAIDTARWLSKISKIECIDHVFKKNPVEDIVIEIPEKATKVTESTVKNLERILDRIKARGAFEAKAVPKRYLKFFRNIYTNDDEYLDLLYNKKVVVLDDSMSSRSTMANIFDVCDYLYKTSDCYGVTVFKKVPTIKK